MNTRKKLIVFMSAALASGSVMAQQSGLQRCADIEDSLERLVCYDNLAQQQAEQRHERVQGQTHGQQVAEQARKKGQQKRANKQHRGHSNAAEERFGMEHKNADELENFNKLVVELESREQDPYGYWIITLKNGQVWKQTEDVGYFSWDEDDVYYIERGALNSFFFGREGVNRRFRVTRIQ